MKKLVCALALMAGVMAHAQQAAASLSAMVALPPSEFDHPFRGRLIAKLDSPVVCGASAWGCTLGPRRGVCVIHLTRKGERFKDQIMDTRAFGRLVRHETGHCNGWAGNHPRARWK